MNPSREELLFQLALSKPAAKRAAWLDAECDGDPALRQRLEVLLAAHDRPDTALAAVTVEARPTIKLDFAVAPDEAVGQTLGRYKLLEKVGEGGCGMVYVAEQKEPVRRKVALKVIKLGMDTKQVVARFEAERQALAMMDHPNIAKVLDAGTTDVGRPFFVMELVRGIRITDYCDQAHLTTKDRLDLFIKVCHAIQHAHQKGIIHREIKPSNILVTLHDGVPVPKVIDFGIAKATQGELTDKAIHTQFQQFIGTPAYMSPEQAEVSGLDIDTRSDIYSLGVLLYELLAGSTPFDAKDLMATGIEAMRKTIREKEPQRPSTRFATLGADQLTTMAKRRSADTSKLLHQLKGDLDWIVMKCLVVGQYLDGSSIDAIVKDTGYGQGTVSAYLNEVQKGAGVQSIRTPPRKRGLDRLQAARPNGLRRASIRDFHSFRVTWITLALAAGVPLELVQRVTGHRTVEVVMKHYFRPGREDFRAAILKAMPKMLADTNGRKSIKEEILELLDMTSARTWKANIQRLRALVETLPR